MNMNIYSTMSQHFHRVSAVISMIICLSRLSFCKDNCDCDRPYEDCIFYKTSLSELAKTQAKIEIFVALYLFLGSVELPMLLLKPKSTMSESTRSRAWSSFISRMELVMTLFIPSVLQIVFVIPLKSTTMAIAVNNIRNILLTTGFASLLNANRATREWAHHFHPKMFGTFFSVGVAIAAVSQGIAILRLVYYLFYLSGMLLFVFGGVRFIYNLYVSGRLQILIKIARYRFFATANNKNDCDEEELRTVEDMTLYIKETNLLIFFVFMMLCMTSYLLVNVFHGLQPWKSTTGSEMFGYFLVIVITVFFSAGLPTNFSLVESLDYERAHKKKRELLHSLSDETQTGKMLLLRAMWNNQLLKEEKIMTETEFDEIQNACKANIYLLENIHMYGQLDSGNLQINVEELSVDSLLGRVLEDLMWQADNSRVWIEVKMVPFTLPRSQRESLTSQYHHPRIDEEVHLYSPGNLMCKVDVKQIIVAIRNIFIENLPQSTMSSSSLNSNATATTVPIVTENESNGNNYNGTEARKQTLGDAVSSSSSSSSSSSFSCSSDLLNSNLNKLHPDANRRDNTNIEQTMLINVSFIASRNATAATTIKHTQWGSILVTQGHIRIDVLPLTEKEVNDRDMEERIGSSLGRSRVSSMGDSNLNHDNIIATYEDSIGNGYSDSSEHDMVGRESILTSAVGYFSRFLNIFSFSKVNTNISSSGFSGSINGSRSEDNGNNRVPISTDEDGLEDGNVFYSNKNKKRYSNRNDASGNEEQLHRNLPLADERSLMMSSITDAIVKSHQGNFGKNFLELPVYHHTTCDDEGVMESHDASGNPSESNDYNASYRRELDILHKETFRNRDDDDALSDFSLSFDVDNVLAALRHGNSDREENLVNELVRLNRSDGNGRGDGGGGGSYLSDDGRGSSNSSNFNANMNETIAAIMKERRALNSKSTLLPTTRN